MSYISKFCSFTRDMLETAIEIFYETNHVLKIISIKSLLKKNLVCTSISICKQVWLNSRMY